MIKNIFKFPRLAGCLLSMVGASFAHAQMPAQFTANITNGANVVTVDFVHHPIRGAKFGVYIQDASSNFVACASPLQTNGTLWEYIIFEAGDRWWADNGQVSGTYGNPTFTPTWPTAAVVTPAAFAAAGTGRGRTRRGTGRHGGPPGT